MLGLLQRHGVLGLNRDVYLEPMRPAKMRAAAHPGERVQFGDGLEAVLFLPAAEGPRPAVIILHERYGLVQHTLDLAARLASDGYVALAPDLFSRWEGDREALARGDVRVTLPDRDVARLIGGSIEFLQSQPCAQREAVVLMGVCQSGRYPVVAASERADVAACVVFYGAAQASDWEINGYQPRAMGEMLATLSAPALFVFGEGDHVISLDDVLRVRAALEAGKRSYRMRIFPDVPHGWLNDTMPGRYRPDAAREAWSMLLDFLDDVLRHRWPGQGRLRWEFESDVAQTYDFSHNRRMP
jgi:carboxymethylenebutenolidase